MGEPTPQPPAADLILKAAADLGEGPLDVQGIITDVAKRETAFGPYLDFQVSIKEPEGLPERIKVGFPWPRAISKHSALGAALGRLGVDVTKDVRLNLLLGSTVTAVARLEESAAGSFWNLDKASLRTHTGLPKAPDSDARPHLDG